MATISKTEDFITHLKDTNAFDEFKNVRLKLIDEGMDKKTAWLEAAKLFGWEQGTNLEQYRKARSETRMRELVRNVKTINFDSDLKWAYGNLANDLASKTEAPSLSAWALLEYGRKSKGKFLETVMRFFMAQKKAAQRKSKAMKEDEKQQLDVIDKLVGDDFLKDFAQKFNARIAKVEVSETDEGVE